MKQLPWLFFAAAAGFVSYSFIPSPPGIALGLAWGAGVILLVRAVMEASPSELPGSVIGRAVVAVIIGFILPVCEKSRLPVIPVVLVVPMALRAFVPLITVGLRLVAPRV